MVYVLLWPFDILLITDSDGSSSEENDEDDDLQGFLFKQLR